MDRTPLDEALLADDHASVERLIQRGKVRIETKDANGRSLLQRAISFDARRTVALLIGLGADVNSRNRWGNAALGNAVRAGRVELIGPLVEAGAEVNTGDTLGNTPLHQVLVCGCGREEEIIRVLLALGADPGKRNLAGDSPRDTVKHRANVDWIRYFS